MIKDLVLKNRSYRGYDRSVVPDMSLLKELVDNARLCPSSVNLQPLKYFITNEESVVCKIQNATGWAKALDIKLPHKGKEPAAFIVICADKTLASNTEAFARDVGICAQTILLSAVEKGLGGIMIGNFKKEEISDIMQKGDRYEPQLIIAVGKPDEEIRLVEAKDGKTKYFRDENDVHYVPKRSLEDIII